jgi:methionyl-tRNA formyltransferase
VLELLAADERVRPSLVLTRPDRPAGRGRRLTAPPVADSARSLGLPLAQPESVNEPEVLAQILDAGAGAPAIVCAFGALIREPLLSGVELLNVHPSLLPRWRGAAPVERAIMAGDAESGVCIMHVTAGLDEGPVALLAREPISAQDTYGTLAARLERAAAGLLVTALLDGPLEFRPQAEQGATYAEKITAADRLLDAAQRAVVLERQVRALTPHIGARAQLAGGELLGVAQAQIVDGAPGPGVQIVDGRVLFGCSDGALELLRVRPPGGREMSGADYARGRAGRL